MDGRMQVDSSSTEELQSYLTEVYPFRKPSKRDLILWFSTLPTPIKDLIMAMADQNGLYDICRFSSHLCCIRAGIKADNQPNPALTSRHTVSPHPLV